MAATVACAAASWAWACCVDFALFVWVAATVACAAASWAWACCADFCVVGPGGRDGRLRRLQLRLDLLYRFLVVGLGGRYGRLRRGQLGLGLLRRLRVVRLGGRDGRLRRGQLGLGLLRRLRVVGLGGRDGRLRRGQLGLGLLRPLLVVGLGGRDGRLVGLDRVVIGCDLLFVTGDSRLVPATWASSVEQADAELPPPEDGAEPPAAQSAASFCWSAESLASSEVSWA